MELANRKMIRLKEYDYSSVGAYFITICTNNPNFKLSQIFDTCNPVGADIIRPKLTPYGKIIEKAINAIPSHYTNVKIDKYIIMPDHVHLILTIMSEDNSKHITLTRVIGQMKRWISKEIGVSIWQKSYYDHVIRDESDYITRWNYIDQNPVKWLLNKSL